MINTSSGHSSDGIVLLPYDAISMYDIYLIFSYPLLQRKYLLASDVNYDARLILGVVNSNGFFSSVELRYS